MKEYKEKANDSDQVIFTDLGKFIEYNEHLLLGFIQYLNTRGTMRGDVFHCGATVKISADEQIVKDYVSGVLCSIVDS